MYNYSLFNLKKCRISDSEQQLQCFNYRNLQPMFAKENMSKGAKILPEYAQFSLLI